MSPISETDIRKIILYVIFAMLFWLQTAYFIITSVTFNQSLLQISSQQPQVQEVLWLTCQAVVDDWTI